MYLLGISMKFCISFRLIYFTNDNLVNIKVILLGPWKFTASQIDSGMKIFDEQH